MNDVALVGKVSRVGQLKYTPSGKPSLEFTLAVNQQVLEANTVGYVEIVLFGETAEDAVQTLRIGKRISVRGQLWVRGYKDRRGIKVNETKVICASLALAEKKDSKEVTI